MYNLSYATTKLEEVLDRFCDSSAKIQEYVYAERDYVDCYSARNSLCAAIKRFGKDCFVKVSVKNGHVYLIKKF